MPLINAELLKILVCPVPECRARLELRGNRLVCSACGRRYPVEERWPVLIPEEAEMPEGPRKPGEAERPDEA
jgi:uncharacterized protein YbaR (Trm112 family)